MFQYRLPRCHSKEGVTGHNISVRAVLFFSVMSIDFHFAPCFAQHHLARCSTTVIVATLALVDSVQISEMNESPVVMITQHE